MVSEPAMRRGGGRPGFAPVALATGVARDGGSHHHPCSRHCAYRRDDRPARPSEMAAAAVAMRLRALGLLGARTALQGDTRRKTPKTPEAIAIIQQ
jgi:hypothetical protein